MSAERNAIAIAEVCELLERGFTGEISLQVRDGVVIEYKLVEQRRPKFGPSRELRESGSRPGVTPDSLLPLAKRRAAT